MKRIFSALVFLAVAAAAHAQERIYTDAMSLTVVNKLLNTKNPYHRLDVEKYPGMTAGEQNQAKYCTGMVIAFRTDSKSISVDVNFAKASTGENSANICTKGFDLYMKDDSGRWLWAGNGSSSKVKLEDWTTIKLIEKAKDGMKDCLLYLPLFSELNELQIVTDYGSRIEKIDNPFKGRIAVFGSSFTHGSGCSRPAMTYSAQLERMTGYQFINMGFSGNSKLQQYFATALLEADVDAYVCDAFSNPQADMIKERLEAFVARFVKEKPGVPLIMVQTIRREKRNFSPEYDARETAKMQTADRMMRELSAQYPNVYWIDSIDLGEARNEATSDGTHPDNYGYTLWARSLEKKIIPILEKVSGLQ